MPFCPKCKYEYVEYVSRCPDCDVNLVHILPEEDEKGFEPVYVAPNEMHANIVRSLLANAGIPVVLTVYHESQSKHGLGFLGGQTFLGANVKMAVNVPKSQADSARRIIEEAHADSPDSDLMHELPDTEEEIEFFEDNSHPDVSEEEDDGGWLRPRGQ